MLKGDMEENELTDMVVKQPAAATELTDAAVKKRKVTGKPRDFLGPSVVACWCCFWPTGAFAIIYSLKARALYSDGDIEEAHAASRKAMILMIISVAIGVGFIIALLIGLAVSGHFKSHT